MAAWTFLLLYTPWANMATLRKIPDERPSR